MIKLQPLRIVIDFFFGSYWFLIVSGLLARRFVRPHCLSALLAKAFQLYATTSWYQLLSLSDWKSSQLLSVVRIKGACSSSCVLVLQYIASCKCLVVLTKSLELRRNFASMTP